MSSPFSHLRVSSEFSITHGLLTIDQIVDKAKEYSTPSVALTDNLNMFGLVKFFNKCEAAGIKPISGSSTFYRHATISREHYYWTLLYQDWTKGSSDIISPHYATTI